MFVVPSVTTATWRLSTFVDLLWWSIMHPTRRDLMIRLLEGSENPISALFNFYAGKTSEKLVLPTIVCQIDGILQHLHCWKCFPREGSHRTFYPLTNNPFFSTNYHSAVTGIFHLFSANSLYQDSEVGKPQRAVQNVWGWIYVKTRIFWVISDFHRSLDSRLSWLGSECCDLSTGSWNIVKLN